MIHTTPNPIERGSTTTSRNLDTGLKIFDSQIESFFLDSPESPHVLTSGLTTMAAIQPIEHIADDHMSTTDTTELHPIMEPKTQEPFNFTTGPLPFGITESDLRVFLFQFTK